jgi:4-amino-4-deoxy-L-arabinose transferase-like glycosyltransferase
MFLFISGSVNNDNLSNALASVLLVQIVRLLKRDTAPSIRELALIGVVAGAGMLAKFNIGFLLPLVGLALAALAWRLRDWRPFLVGSGHGQPDGADQWLVVLPQLAAFTATRPA